MPLLDKIREEKLINLAKACFDPPPTGAEEKVLRDSASSVAPDVPVANAPRPAIRPELVRWLASDPEAVSFIDPKGLRVFGVTLPGDLDLENCCIAVPLYFCGCDLKCGINLRSAETKGIVLLECSVDGAFLADRVKAHDRIFLRESRFSNTIRLLGARIHGILDCSGSNLEVKAKEGEKEVVALSADGAVIDGGVYLHKGFTSSGSISLLGARIMGDLDCSGAKLELKEIDACFKEGVALAVQHSKIGGSVYLNDGFTSSGTIGLLGARIKGSLDCSGAKLEVEEGTAFSADRAEIDGNVTLNDGFSSSGEINLVGARIGGQLDFQDAKVAEVYCSNLRLSADLFWIGIRKTERTALVLAGAVLKNLHDDQQSWPDAENLVLDGLVYEELTLRERPTSEDTKDHHLPKELPLNVEERVEWLMLQPEKVREKPQSWMQLAKLLEAKGNSRGAKHVIFKYRALLAKEKEFHPVRWLLNKLLFWLRTFRRVWPYFRHPNRSWAIAFAWLEEAPLRICWSIALTLMVGTLIFAGAFSSGAMLASVQIQPNAVLPNGESKNLSAHYPLSQPFLYTLENAVPLVKLGMDEKWMPDPKYEHRPWFPQVRWLNGMKWFSSYWLLVASRVLLIFLGWFQAGVLGAVLLRRFKE